MIFHYGAPLKSARGGSSLWRNASPMINGISLPSEDGRCFDPTTRWQNGPEFLLICKFIQIPFLRFLIECISILEWIVPLACIVYIVPMSKRKAPGSLRITGVTIGYATSGEVSRHLIKPTQNQQNQHGLIFCALSSLLYGPSRRNPSYSVGSGVEPLASVHHGTS